MTSTAVTIGARTFVRLSGRERWLRYRRTVGTRFTTSFLMGALFIAHRRSAMGISAGG